MLTSSAAVVSSLIDVINFTRCIKHVFTGSGWRGIGWRPGSDSLPQPTWNYSQVLITNKAFLYPTNVYGWKVRFKNSRAEGGWLAFQIWRPKSGGFDLIGSTNFSYDLSRGNGYTNTEIPLQAHEEISVDQGDVIGLFLPYGARSVPFELGFDPTASDSSDILLFTVPSNQDPPIVLRTTDYDEHAAQYVINISAMTGQEYNS